VTVLFTLIMIQALLGALDNLWHHEIVARLPSRRAAARETALHAAREALYGLLFLGLAGWAWHGGWALAIGLLLLIEIGITLADFVIEDRTRRLPETERVLHTVLAINFGAILAAFVPVLQRWFAEPTALVPVDHGAFSLVFTCFGVAVLVWAARNAAAALRHRRPPEWVRDPIEAGSVATGRTVLVTGATGFIGAALVRSLRRRGDAVIVLARDADRALERFGPHARIVTNLDALPIEARIDAIVNLAGSPILAWPWTRARRRTLLASRIDTTRAVVALCEKLDRRPRVLISASAIGFYGVRGDEAVNEDAAHGAGFQSQLCMAWEDEARAAIPGGTRVVLLRLGLVLGASGGALLAMARPVRFALGAVIGDGRQWVSWIHLDDVLRLVLLALDTPILRGPVNAVAPGAVRHGEFQHLLARALRRPLLLRLPAFVLRTALGEQAELLADGQRVVPDRAIDAGFRFVHARLVGALDAALQITASRDPAPPRRVYFNGDCPVCSHEIQRYARRIDLPGFAGDGPDRTAMATVPATAARPLELIDVAAQPLSLQTCGLRPEHVQRRLYVRLGDGRYLSGLPALVALWRRTPGLRVAAWFWSRPGLRALGALVYDVVLAPTLARIAVYRGR
jgi:uncharacterized protein